MEGAALAMARVASKTLVIRRIAATGETDRRARIR